MRFVLFVLAAALVAAAPAAEPRRPLFKDFMGINGHTVQFRPELYKPVASLVRDYHPAEWDLGTESDFLTPFPSARNGVDWSKVYGSWKQQEWRTDACVMFETLPREKWKNLAADSMAYAERFARALGPQSTNALVVAAWLRHALSLRRRGVCHHAAGDRLSRGAAGG